MKFRSNIENPEEFKFQVEAIRGMFRIQSSIRDGTFYKNCPRLKTNGISAKSPTSDN